MVCLLVSHVGPCAVLPPLIATLVLIISQLLSHSIPALEIRAAPFDPVVGAPTGLGFDCRQFYTSGHIFREK